jgi:hypothetical protein
VEIVHVDPGAIRVTALECHHRLIAEIFQYPGCANPWLMLFISANGLSSGLINEIVRERQAHILNGRESTPFHLIQARGKPTLRRRDKRLESSMVGFRE